MLPPTRSSTPCARAATIGGANEAKLSHLTNLRARIRDANLVAADLARPDLLADQKTTRWARERVTGRVSLEGRACTPVMFDTPRRLLRHRARVGHWSSFPSDPARFHERFRPAVDRKSFITKGKTFAIATRLVQRLADLDGPRRSQPDRLALYRGFHTAGLELADAPDDSYRVIGQARTDAWLTYLSIDWRTAGIDPNAYWQDPCELQIWEPYAVDYGNETAWFSFARRGDVDVIEAILLALEAEHRRVVLDYEADAALEALTDPYLATETRDRYVEAARRLGSRSWRHIEAVATSQCSSGDRDGAIAVFRAADQPGWHRDHLRAKCLAVTGVDLAADNASTDR